MRQSGILLHLSSLPYAGVIWDFDGTLFDTYPLMTEAMILALAGTGFAAPQEEVLGYMLNSYGHCVDHYAALHGLAPGELRELYHRAHDHLGETARPFPEIMPILKA
jgi:phosphoglycolate phosphatase-like HAD superfamily hydrolase